MATKPNNLAHFVLTFVGGDMDGRVLDSRSPTQQERAVVEMFLGASGRGKVGCATKSLVSYQTFLEDQSPSAVQNATTAKLHTYMAIDREVKDGACHVRVENTVLNIFADQRDAIVNHPKRDTQKV